MRKNKTILKAIFKYAFAVLFVIGISFNGTAQTKTTDEILQSFVESYRTDPMALTVDFGIKVGDDWWYVKSLRKQEAYMAGKSKQYTLHNYGPHEVTLFKGQPSVPGWYFEFADRETLDKINDQVWTATTAAAKSTAADVTALNILDSQGFKSSRGDEGIAYQVLEHFWKKDKVEITRFSRDATLPSHGADIVGLYTMKDKRISWFSLGPEQAANADRGLDRGQVPNLFIITKGRGQADFGEGLVELEPGMSVFVAPYVKHVIYNPYNEPLEGILVLFGDNPDFVYGQSYLDFLDKEYEFYEKSNN